MREQVKPEAVRPPDFVSFWQATREELAAVDPAPSAIARESRGGCELADVEFSSLDGVRVRGYTITGPGPRPLIVHSHGYGSQCEPMWRWAQRGVDVLGVDIRGFGASSSALPQRNRHGYVLTGIDSPETSVLRAAVCDYAQAVRVGRESRTVDSRLVSHGISFAGGLALMAEAVFQRADVLVVGVPTFGWGDGRHFYVKQGSGAEVSSYVARRPQLAEDVALVLRYFDSMLFAPDVRCPTLVGLGREDIVVPAKTVYAIANHLAGPHEILEFPVSHTDHPDEQLWDAFDGRCVDLALHGAPPGFGSERLTRH